MSRIIFITILIFAFCPAVFAQEKLPIVDPRPFDRFGESRLNDEKGRFDNFFITLSKDKNAQAVVFFQLDKHESKAEKRQRLREISKFFNLGKIDKSRFTFLVYEEEEEFTTFWIIPENTSWNDLLYFEDKDYKLIKGEEFEQKIDELFPKK
jgi:hypothetical protein